MNSIHLIDRLDGMTSLTERFQNGLTYDEMVAGAESNVDLYRSLRARAVAPPEYGGRIDSTGRHWHLLVISEDWCGDAVNIVPWIDAMTQTSSLSDMRMIERDENLDLIDQHLTGGVSRSIPVVLILDDQLVERGWWGPRPSAIQTWFATPEAQSLSKDDRYKELRTRYARDRGRSVMEEITSLIERIAAQGSSTVSATAQTASSA